MLSPKVVTGVTYGGTALTRIGSQLAVIRHHNYPK